MTRKARTLIAKLNEDAKAAMPRDGLLRLGNEWSLPATLARLAGAANHLLRDHDCDAHGYEGVTSALRAAEAWLNEEGYGALLEEGWDRFCIMKHRAEEERVAKAAVEGDRPMAAVVNWEGLATMLGMTVDDVKKTYLKGAGMRPRSSKESLALSCDVYDGDIPSFKRIMADAIQLFSPRVLGEKFEVSADTVRRWAHGLLHPRPKIRLHVASVLYDLAHDSPGVRGRGDSAPAGFGAEPRGGSSGTLAQRDSGGRAALPSDPPRCASCRGSGWITPGKPCMPCWDEVGENPPSEWDGDDPPRNWGDL
jgi:hypothetical protein